MNEAFAHDLQVRKEGQVELSGKTPNWLSAGRYCEIAATLSTWFFAAKTLCVSLSTRQRQVIYEIKSTANWCIALSSSTNAVSISSPRTVKSWAPLLNLNVRC